MTRDPRTKAVRPRILCFDELAAFVSKAKQEGNTLLPALCTLFEGNYVDNIMKDRKMLCRDAYVSLVGACALETYEKMWAPQFLDMGSLLKAWTNSTRNLINLSVLSSQSPNRGWVGWDPNLTLPAPPALLDILSYSLLMIRYSCPILTT